MGSSEIQQQQESSKKIGRWPKWLRNRFSLGMIIGIARLAYRLWRIWRVFHGSDES